MSTKTPEEGRYSKVTRRMWNDEKFQKLSKAKPNAQTLWQRALSGPELGVIPGLFAAREGGLADHLGWPIAAFRRCWKEIADQEMAEADWRAGLVWVPNAIVHNEPNSTNAILGWRTPLRELPECALKQKAVAALRAYCDGKGPLWVKAFDAACQDQKSKTPSDTPSGTASGTQPGTTSWTPSKTPSDTPSGTASGTQDQDQDARSRSQITTKFQDLTADRAGDAGVVVEMPELQRKYLSAQKNPGIFSMENGVAWPEFLVVWDAWCKPFGITGRPVITQRIDQDITAIINAFAAGHSMEQLLAVGKVAESNSFIAGLREQRKGGPSAFTPKMIRQLLAEQAPSVAKAAGDLGEYGKADDWA